MQAVYCTHEDGLLVLTTTGMVQVFIYRIRKYLGAYLVHLKGRVDAIVFSAGIGENAAHVRQAALADLEVKP